MRLRDGLKLFAKQAVFDAYTGAATFTGHFDIYDGSVRDSITGGRRTVAVLPEVVVPARRAITYQSGVFLIGDAISDSQGSEVLKRHLILHPADGLAKVATSAEMISGSGGTEMYVGKSWRKSQKEETESSELFDLYNFYMASNENAARNSLLLLSGKYFRVQGFESTTGGYNIAVASELDDDTFQSVSYTPASGAYDPVTDVHSVSPSFSVDGFVERYQTSYRYVSPSAPKFKSGDVMFTCLDSAVAVPGTGDKVQINSISYDVVGFASDGSGAFEMHLRPM